MAGPPIFFKATQAFRLVPDNRFAAGEWKAMTRDYIYTVYEQTADRQLGARSAWHWHPGSGGTPDPHIHVHAGDQIFGREVGRLHIPSERVAFESVTMFLVDDLGVRPERADWREITSSALAMFMRFRTWPRSVGPSLDAEPS